MRGNTLEGFMADIAACGGPEKEFLYRGKTYLLETDFNGEHGCAELVMFECGEGTCVFRCLGGDCAELARKFGKAKLFDGRTIREAEGEIEVLFG